MSDWGLRGNETAVERIREAAGRGTLAHALLFSGTGDRKAMAEFAAAAFECGAEGARPCGVCEACRKVRAGIHPDVIVVEDSEHKNTAVELIRSARSDAYIRPNEGSRKVYLFPDCSALTEQDQNVLLKIVEEGPPYAVFLFCAENPSVVLPTLRSRCVELKLYPDAAEEEGGSAVSKECEALCRAAALKKRTRVTEEMIRLERSRLSRDDLKSLLEESRTVFSAALLTSYGSQQSTGASKIASELAKNLTKMQIMRTIELLQKYQQECFYNVSPGQVLGALAVELEGIL